MKNYYYYYFCFCRLKFKIVPDSEYKDIYYNQLYDPTFKGTVLTCDIEHALNVYNSQTRIPTRFVPIPITSSYYAFGFLYPNLWNERLQEIMSGLITGGIINHHLEVYTKSKWNLNVDEFESEKIVLNLSHLGFGFQICFILLYSALVVFIFELIFKWVVHKSKLKLWFLKHH